MLLEKLVASSWADDDLYRRLIADPISTLREAGVCIKQGFTVKVIEAQEYTALEIDNSGLLTLRLQSKPDNTADWSVNELQPSAVVFCFTIASCC